MLCIMALLGALQPLDSIFRYWLSTCHCQMSKVWRSHTDVLFVGDCNYWASQSVESTLCYFGLWWCLSALRLAFWQAWRLTFSIYQNYNKFSDLIPTYLIFQTNREESNPQRNSSIMGTTQRLNQHPLNIVEPWLSSGSLEKCLSCFG